MREGFCASILQMDASICCVTRTADRLLENAQRCQSEDHSIFANEEPNAMRFRVTDFMDGYQYELAVHPSYYQLTFPVSDNILSVVIDKQADVVNLAKRIAKFARIQQDSKVLTLREEQYPVHRVTEARIR
jgi:hypothetical protein